MHKNILLVASDAKAAKARALEQIRGWASPHRDRQFEVEMAVDVSALMQSYGRFLSLKPATREKPFSFVCNYLPIAQ